MTGARPDWSVFTKPWPGLEIPALAAKIRALGFTGAEFPLREGFQVTPADAERGLPRLAGQFGREGLLVHSVAGSLEERVFAGCAAAGIPMIRIMIPIGTEGYLAAEDNARKMLDAALPWCQEYEVCVGIQQHHGAFVSDSTGLRRILEPYPAEYVGAVWDAAHDALAGQRPDLGLELVWSHLRMVNLKNAYYRRSTGPERAASWTTHFTTGQHGLARWPEVADYLLRREYSGPICLTAQYTAAESVDEFLVEDLSYAKALFRA
jgi:sugar phosphate isomerase/epimerase